MSELNIFFIPTFAFGVFMMLYALYCDMHFLFKPAKNHYTAVSTKKGQVYRVR